MKNSTDISKDNERLAFEPLLCPVLYTYVTTHNSFHEGGRKVHVTELGTGKALCGYKNLYSPTAQIDVDWLNQPDADGNMCQKCKKIALRLLNGA